MHTGILDDLCLQLMELGVQHLMWNAFSVQHPAQFLGSIDIDGAHQHRLTGLMGLLDVTDNRTQLFFLRLVYRIVQILSLYRSVGGDLDDVHAVNVTELFFLGLRRTGHTAFFIIFVEKVLEGDGGQRLALPFYLYLLFCLNGLMQAVGIPSARHDTAGELIDDQYFVILHHIIPVTEHQVVGTQRQNDVVLDLQILRVCQVFNVEEILHLLHTGLGQVHDLIFLVDHKVAGLLHHLTHEGIHLRQLPVLALLQLAGKNVAHLIQLRGLAALTGNDQRGSGLVDEDRIHLVDDGVVKAALYQLCLVDDHVVTQVVKSQLVVGNVSDITVVRFPALVFLHGVEHAAHLQPQEFMNSAHPLCVTVCQIVVDRHDVDALTFQGI